MKRAIPSQGRHAILLSLSLYRDWSDFGRMTSGILKEPASVATMYKKTHQRSALGS